jgi:hypothetical protein
MASRTHYIAALAILLITSISITIYSATQLQSTSKYLKQLRPEDIWTRWDTWISTLVDMVCYIALFITFIAVTLILTSIIIYETIE